MDEFDLTFNARETVVNDQFDIIRTSKCGGQIIKLFGKLLRTSQKGSLQLQKVENCIKGACTRMIEANQ